MQKSKNPPSHNSSSQTAAQKKEPNHSGKWILLRVLLHVKQAAKYFQMQSSTWRTTQQQTEYSDLFPNKKTGNLKHLFPICLPNKWLIKIIKTIVWQKWRQHSTCCMIPALAPVPIAESLHTDNWEPCSGFNIRHKKHFHPKMIFFDSFLFH